MDFRSFKTSVKEKSKKIFQKTKDFGKKSVRFTGKQVASTPLFIQKLEEYDTIQKNKRAIFVAFDEKSELGEELPLLFPLWGTKAWIDGATLRYLNIEKSEDILHEEKFKLPLEMRVFYMEKEEWRSNDLEAIKKWWKKRVYEGKEDEITTENKEAPTTKAEEIQEREAKESIKTTHEGIVPTEPKIQTNSPEEETSTKTDTQEASNTLGENKKTPQEAPISTAGETTETKTLPQENVVKKEVEVPNETGEKKEQINDDIPKKDPLLTLHP